MELTTTRLFPNRHLRVCYLDSEKRFIGSAKLQFEEKLAKVAQIELVPLQSLDDPKFHPCDLLVLTANLIPEDHFKEWLTRLRKNMRSQAKVWTPALILSDIEFPVLNEIFQMASAENWYFDIVTTEHYESLPIRIANLLRVHDHLHELRRYSETLANLQIRVDKLEDELTDFRKK